MLQLTEFALDSFWIYCTLSLVAMVTLVTTLASCMCCRKQEIKNDLLGLEGMVKLTNPEDTLNSQDTTPGTGIGGGSAIGGPDQTDCSEPESISKRASNAPHRSLPDIPVVEPIGDNNSELYATVGDKVQDLPQGRSPTSSLKKHASVSQHSSISQADDISSPYARVRSPSHAYDKLRRAEHPYAQVVQPGTSGTAQAAGSADDELLSPISRRGGASTGASGGGANGRDSNQSLLDEREGSSVDIPAASAIAGRVSASQDLPYMTPPIVQPPQHFSGDSQDSSKGYTSISVREPLANLLPQTQNQTTAQRRQMMGDSHYATVSDDSDEMYAAIEDPNHPGDHYTSGSETYAQIQPPNMVTVSVEINTGASSRPSAGHPTDSLDVLQPHPANSSSSAKTLHNRHSSASGTNVPLEDPSSSQLPPPPIDSLRAHQSHVAYAHSRQASSSSCTSSVGNLGSPKPEKRQANSPLPPTPKTLKHQSTNSFFSNSNLTSISSNTSTQTGQSGRNSVASVIEYKSSRENIAAGKTDDLQLIGNGSAIKPKKSPSKDLEGMYAKVMKKNKLSKAPSQNSSPVPPRKEGTALLADVEQFLSDPELTQLNGSSSLHGSPSKKPLPTISSGNDYETLEKNPSRHHHHHRQQQDPGYETIPGDSISNTMGDLRKSTDYSQVQKRPQAVAQGIQSVSRNSLEIFHGLDKSATDGEPGYESLPGGNDPGYETLNRNRAESDSDPNYEILRPTRDNDGYSSIRDKRTAKNRLDFGKDDDNDSTPGYSSIKERIDYDPGYSVISEKKKPPFGHDYASITEETKRKKQNLNNNNPDPGEESDIYSSITNAPIVGNATIAPSSIGNNNYSTIPEPTNLTSSPGYSSISETRTTPSTDSTSSPDNLIGYAKQHNTATNNSNSRLSSNYESLTGSESDPNYESVKYLNVRENPYERLHNEPGQTPSTGGPSLTDSLNRSTDSTVFSPSQANAATDSDTVSVECPSANTVTGSSQTPSVCELEATGVSDYFQV
ncbi:serine-rich adhesin for platelets-like isoform X1 [Topomyia yanbarensis]|uniref:serine-rich adhesin for platelets-like isoform X1 n=1 Tax=Topomyia yanbarensis TaxID=2498891 RepID=UPI00273AFAB1|nr:serine-rich adhesin for platelets-like isoform X1 [Topomyia yanbarensis]XP_058839815.1 serine-rich adhesin for platelets-like isoform X1 [Topomyia yanbarensis]XP_058839816.1 serine-rich adhesin for platelets-like isoform X1 [Topomyia yanbarensis]XP_058839817.1 serine-rich adhesin for platelets-like isoform X1 [Topomyia yanbarensis]